MASKDPSARGNRACQWGEQIGIAHVYVIQRWSRWLLSSKHCCPKEDPNRRKNRRMLLWMSLEYFSLALKTDKRILSQLILVQWISMIVHHTKMSGRELNWTEARDNNFTLGWNLLCRSREIHSQQHRTVEEQTWTNGQHKIVYLNDRDRLNMICVILWKGNEENRCLIEK